MNGKGDRPRPVSAEYAENNERIFGYRRFTRDIGCLVCGAWMPDLHHVKSRGAGGKDEKNIVPLCRVHHTECHTIGRLTFEDKHKLGDLKIRAEQIWEKYEDMGTH